MRKEHLLPININKAEIKRIALIYQDNNVRFSAEVQLYSGVRPITSLYVGNDNWDKDKNAEMPLGVVVMANNLREEIKTVVVRYLNSQQKILTMKKGK